MKSVKVIRITNSTNLLYKNQIDFDLYSQMIGNLRIEAETNQSTGGII